MITSNSVIYQIYTLGFCDAPFQNDAILSPRVLKVLDWLKHIEDLGADTILFNPIFESTTHGYDTSDYYLIDKRLGTNDDFKLVSQAIKSKNINIILDAVFNHVGRDFWAFKDVLEHKWDSHYKDWFFIRDGNNCYNDGFNYDCWEGCTELVRLNLRNEEVITHIFDAVKMWITEFSIDGLRLDVAYCLDKDFLKQLHYFTKSINPDFFILGETLHGDYNQWVNNEMLDSCTNYECYKGLHSSFNSENLFEISHSLYRQFGTDPWCLYQGKHLLSFVDNHDVSRIASILNVKQHLPLIYTLLFTMPGIPSIYYGSEWGVLGKKQEGDPSLRLAYDKPLFTDLTKHIQRLCLIKKNESALCDGSYNKIIERNKQFIFIRELNNEKIFIAINLSESNETLACNIHGSFIELLSDEKIVIDGTLELVPYTSLILKTKV